MCHNAVYGLALLVILTSRAVPDGVAEYNNICNHLREGRYEEAETQFQNALERFPGSARFRSMHLLMYTHSRRAGRWPEAAYHANAYVDHLFEQYRESSDVSGLLASLTNRMAIAYIKAGEPEQGLANLDRLSDKLDSLPKRDDVTGLLVEVNGLRAILQHERGDTDRAVRTIENVRKSSRKSYHDSPDNAVAADLQARSLQADVLYAAHVNVKDVARASRESFAFIIQQAKKYPDNGIIIYRLYKELPQIGGVVCHQNPRLAEEFLAEGNAFFTALTPQRPRIQQLKDNWMRAAILLQSNIEKRKIMLEQ
jgi:tetratricopeptide (TPR) repeat protein